MDRRTAWPMRMATHSAWIVSLLTVVAGCQGRGTSTPTAPIAEDAPDAPTAAVGFPPLTGPGRIYSFSALTPPYILDDAVEYTKASRYALYDDGSFAIQSSDTGPELTGAYTETDGVVSFHWQASNTAGPWEATGTLTGDSLAVTYNIVMWLVGFMDAVYALAP